MILLVVAVVSVVACGGEDAGWSRVPHDEAVFGGADNQEMRSVAAGGPGLIAVGTDESGGWSAAVWTSPDGLTWTRLSDEAVFGGPENQGMASVVAGGPGFVAVGYDSSSGDGEDAAVWTSPDGLTWTRVPHDQAVFGGADSQWMNEVAVGGPGLVAVGIASSDRDTDAAVWTSPDGLTWTRVPHDETVLGGPGTQFMASVVVGGPGLVAVGYDSSGDGQNAAVWTSPDGLTWTRVPHDEATFAYAEMSSVAAGGPGLVAVGTDYMGGDLGGAAVWTSPDGLTWTRVPHDETVFGGPGTQFMASVVVGGPGLVAVGFDESDGDNDAAVWTSPDGLTWTRVPHDKEVFGGPDNQVMVSVVAGGPGLVAVGSDGASYGGDSDAAVWHWTPDQ